MNKKDKQAVGIVGAMILLAIVAAIIDATLPKAPTTDNEEEATTAEPLSTTI